MICLLKILENLDLLVYHTKLSSTAVLVLGSESNGISDSIRKIVDTKISIPRFGNYQLTESLNVATATAILLSEFRRWIYSKAKLRNTPLVEKTSTGEVQGLSVLLSSTSSRFIAKTPRIDGENLKKYK